MELKKLLMEKYSQIVKKNSFLETDIEVMKHQNE